MDHAFPARAGTLHNSPSPVHRGRVPVATLSRRCRVPATCPLLEGTRRERLAEALRALRALLPRQRCELRPSRRRAVPPRQKPRDIAVHFP